MKKLLILAAATALCACGGNKYVIKGEVEGLEGTVYLFDREEVVIDSAAVENGAFQIKGEAEKPTIAYLSDSPAGEPSAFSVMLILEPGTIAVATDAESLTQTVSGTPANDASAAYSAAAKALIEEYRNPETADERREAIEEEYEQLGRTTMEANRTNYFGAMLLQQIAYDLSGQEILDEIALFPAELQQTEVLETLKETAEQKQKSDVGQPFIDVVQNTAEGEPLALSAVVPTNKYTLLDFWASWCGPCMGEVPVLTKTYAAFHDKGFEIYGVSFDKSRENWLKAIEENKMGWLHVSNLTAFDNQAAKDYAIQGIPSNFLIDAQGTIVAKNLRGEALYEKIAELLGE